MMENNGAGSVGSIVRDVAATINNSASLLLVVAGVLLIGASAVIRDGVVPALMTIWGAGMILVGVGAYTTLWWIKR